MMRTKNSHPMIIAHRGARTEAPENTAAAFDKALSYAVCGIELDLQMSRDGVPVVYHDRTLYRTQKKLKRISDVTFAELQSLDWGGWYSPEFQGELLLSLRDVLLAYADKTQLFIEIKSRPRDIKSGWSRRLTEKVVQELEAITSIDPVEAVFLLSFDPEVLKVVHSSAPRYRLIWNLPDKTAEFKARLSGIIKNPTAYQHVMGFCVKLGLLSPEFVSLAHNLGKQALTYTCNSPAHIKKALDARIDVLMTDRPGWAISYMQSGVRIIKEKKRGK